ncbi:MAG: hypothetical protein AseanaTS_05890 [Candidatus Pelagadaptatus aseana]|uniref:hypothetical protein n=1 Tax=Candidatus Pelagadaptatus aseana TaxID=3120508 RepID=UPI0039B26E3B
MVTTTHLRFALCWLIAMTLLTGCESTVEVSGNYPKPLIQPMPVDGGLILDEDFRNYSFFEQDKRRWSRTITLGNSQAEMLRTVVPSMFTSLEVRESMPANFSGKPQLWLHPTALEFQYATPRETRLKLFEVWIKYQIKAYDNQGQIQADWIVTAYGKTPTAFLRSEEEALNLAVVVALRDFGANLSLTTPKVAELQQWLAQQTQSE